MKKLTVKGYEFVKSNFNVKKMVDDIDFLYEKLLNNSRW